MVRYEHCMNILPTFAALLGITDVVIRNVQPSNIVLYSDFVFYDNRLFCTGRVISCIREPRVDI